ncbi:HNH endonuclease [Paenibacillus elgii]|uniref:HNH endonuclease n=1 Tax=Paenibacillus elgii TaxID=189691 RepID=UPI0013D486FA|nr:hypothetical protein [Paenibacillus elgii]
MWIESHQGLRNHPKTKRLRRKLGVDAATAVGYLHFLWWWALDHAPDGNLQNYDAVDIADAIDWEGDEQQLVASLLTAGFLDYDEASNAYSLHDWEQYGGKLQEYRQFQASQDKRKRNLYDDSSLTRSVRERDGDNCRYCGTTVNWKDRKGSKGGTYDIVDPEGLNTFENVVVACRGCASKKNNKSLVESGISLIPHKNQTAYDEDLTVSAGNLPGIQQISSENLLYSNSNSDNKPKNIKPNSSSNMPAHVGDGDQAPLDSQTPVDPMIGEPELSAAAAYMPILESAYREIFGGLLMPPLISNFIVTQLKRGMTVETVKELLWEAGESAQGGKPPSLRLLEPIAERWHKEGIVSRADNQSRLARGQPAGGGGREPTRKANHSGKPKLEVATAKQPSKKLTRDEYRKFYDQARSLDGLQPMTDEEFEEVWNEYQARGERTK